MRRATPGDAERAAATAEVRAFRVYLTDRLPLGVAWRPAEGEPIPAAAIEAVIVQLEASRNADTRARIRVLRYFQFREILPDFPDWCEAEGITERTAYRWCHAAAGLALKYMRALAPVAARTADQQSDQRGPAGNERG